MDADEVDSSFWQVSFFCNNMHESYCLIRFACLILPHLSYLLILFVFLTFAHICSYLLILSHNVCLSHSLAIAFFSVEYVARLVLCPKKWKWAVLGLLNKTELMTFPKVPHGPHECHWPCCNRSVLHLNHPLWYIPPSSHLNSHLLPRVARHEDHQQGRHHDPSGQENIFS